MTPVLCLLYDVDRVVIVLGSYMNVNTEEVTWLGEKIRLPNKRILPLHDHPAGGKFAVWEQDGKLCGWREGKVFEPTQREAEAYILLEVQKSRINKS